MQGAPLSEIKILLAGASLFVGNDSGPAHMAAAFGVPAVVIFSASDPEIWGPWRTAGEVVRAPAGVEQVLDALRSREGGSGMKQILRLTSYGRKFWPQILVSVFLMALAGAAQGMMPLLIQPIFDRVLVTNAPSGPIPAPAASDSSATSSTCTIFCRFTGAAIGS